jgi:hypothetical protein
VITTPHKFQVPAFPHWEFKWANGSVISFNTFSGETMQLTASLGTATRLQWEEGTYCHLAVFGEEPQEVLSELMEQVRKYDR